MTDEDLDTLKCFFPYAQERMKEAEDSALKFVHYTSAENAIRILRENAICLRNARLMNDFSEINFGIARLQSAWADQDLRDRFSNVLESLHVGLTGLVESYFNHHKELRTLDTFMLSVSEHGSEQIDEDKYGRLSMWRAYGGNTNVALVLNNGPFLRPSDALNAYTSPVLYADDTIFKNRFGELIESLHSNREALRNFDIQTLAAVAAQSFHFSALSTKHLGFAEEREWRVIYAPFMERSDKLEEEILIISGVPQRVHKLKLEDHINEGFWGARIPDLVERLIIGPTQYPWPMHDAFVDELKKAGVENAEDKVWVSDIPLRR